MMPAAPMPGYRPAPGFGPGPGQGHSHMPRTQAEKTRTFILLGVLVVAVIGVVIMLASGKKKGIDCESYVEKSVLLATQGRTGADRDTVENRVRTMAESMCASGDVSDEEAECVESSSSHDELLQCMGMGGGGAQPQAPAPTPAPAPAPATPTAPAPDPAAGAATTPKGAPINIPECAEVEALRKQIDACAGISADRKKSIDDDADNKVSVFDGGAPSGEYAEYVRGKCAMTIDTFKEVLAEAGCK